MVKHCIRGGESVARVLATTVLTLSDQTGLVVTAVFEVESACMTCSQIHHSKFSIYPSYAISELLAWQYFLYEYTVRPCKFVFTGSLTNYQLSHLLLKSNLRTKLWSNFIYFFHESVRICLCKNSWRHSPCPIWSRSGVWYMKAS